MGPCGKPMERYNHAVAYTTIFFDLDDTLYPAKCGLWRDIGKRISLYMHQCLDIPTNQVDDLRHYYFEHYGTTLLGLRANYALDINDYLKFVHDLPLPEYIRPVPGLRAVLGAMPQRKIIFTNADVGHAHRVLEALGLDGCFDGVLDVLTMFPYCKPMPESFVMAQELAGESDPQRCVLIDDQRRTTLAARQRGMYSILFGADDPQQDADMVLNDLLLLPWLLDGRG